MRKDLLLLNKKLICIVKKECREKKRILLTLSGGMDTRLVLSILLKIGIKPDVVTWDGSHNDIKIANRIAKNFGLNLTIVPKKTSDVDWLKSVNNVLAKYDVIFYGELMSEVFNKFVRFTESEKKLNNLITDYFKWVEENVDKNKINKVFPCLDKKVMDIVYNMPICFRVYGYINRNLIKHNYPALMKYPHTTVNIRYRLIEYIYWLLVPFIETLIRK